MRYKNLRGVERVNRIFDQLPRAAVEEITHAMNTGLEEMKDTAKTLVAKDTGELAEDIQTDIREGREKIVGRVFVGTDKGTAIKARTQEFSRAPSDGHPGHEARPFMFPAYWAKRKRVTGRVKRAIAKAAKMVVRGG